MRVYSDHRSFLCHRHHRKDHHRLAGRCMVPCSRKLSTQFGLDAQAPPHNVYNGLYKLFVKIQGWVLEKNRQWQNLMWAQAN